VEGDGGAAGEGGDADTHVGRSGHLKKEEGSWREGRDGLRRWDLTARLLLQRKKGDKKGGVCVNDTPQRRAAGGGGGGGGGGSGVGCLQRLKRLVY
jgi:hypothetical protein